MAELEAEVVVGSQAATTTRALQQSGCNSITPEQHAVINGLMQQRDVFAVHVLPGGCDKTTCYSSLSLLHKQMSSPEDFPIIIVICAHNNTVKTQVNRPKASLVYGLCYRWLTFILKD